MDSLKIGDEIIVIVNNNNENDPHWEERKVQVIGFNDHESLYTHICYVPPHVNVKRSFKLKNIHQKHYGFHDKFIDEMGMFLTHTTQIVTHFKQPNGANCTRCGVFVETDEIIEPFRCWLCTQYPWR